MKKKLIFIIIFMLVFSLYFYQENNYIETTNFNIVNERIPKEFNNFRIVQVSDLHNKEFKNNKLVKLIQEQDPEIIVITGDLVDARKTNIEIAVNFVANICNICPVYYVNGNHEGSVDYYSDLEKQLLELGVIVLNDKIDKINMGNSSINICGFLTLILRQKLMKF